MRKLFGLMAGVGMVAVLLAGCPPAEVADAGATDAGKTDSRSGDRPRTDAARRDTGGGGCGTLTILGECVGTVSRYCASGAVEEVDCATAGTGVTCGLVDCDDDEEACYGYGCLAPTGGECSSSDQIFCNTANNEGCVNGVCATSTACDPDTYTATCESANVAAYCHWQGMVWKFDCSFYNETGANYACAITVGDYICGGAQGGECDMTSSDPFPCAPGYTCSSATGAGTCSGGSTDAGAHDTRVNDAAPHDTAVTDTAAAQ